MYDKDFIFKECGFDWLPPEVNRDLLFNVSYELGSGEVKLYILDEGRRFLHKVSRGGVTRQCVGTGADPAPLAKFLGTDFDFAQLVIDTVEGDVYYLYIEEASPPQYVKLLDCVCLRCRVPHDRFVQAVNRINRRPIDSFLQCCANRAVSGIKVPLTAGQPRIYSRPFLTGNGYDLPAPAAAFLARLYACPAADLASRLTHLWVSAELLTGRMVLTTQYDELIHGARRGARN
jgi:hypothetical protein